MGDVWDRWWPTILGVLLLGVAGFFLWPHGPPQVAAERPLPASVAGPPTTNGVQSERGADLQRQHELEEAQERAARRAAAAERDAPPAVSAPPAQIPGGEAERVRTVTLTQDSPEVRRALRSVEVELYETQWCQYCKKTRAFLDRSGISYRAYDVETDETAKLRKERLAQRSGVPLTVIDGVPVTGFSEAALNDAFQTAVRRRLAAR